MGRVTSRPVSLFRRKRDDRSPPEGGGARNFDEVVSPFFAAGDWGGLVGALDRVDPQELEKPQAIQWYTSRGVAAERLGRRDEAVSAYTEGLRRHPDSSALHCIRGRLLEEEGRFDEALQHFRSVRLDDGGGNAVMTAARYCYLWDALDDAVALHSQIFTAYFALRIADDHFLYMRGLPFFSRAYRAQAAVLVLGERADEAKRLLKDSETHLSDLYGIEEERLTLEATLGRPSGLIEHLSGEAQPEEGEAPRGYAGMQLAAWLARESDQRAQAEQWLESVNLREDDWPWLEDIRLLATIAAARRAGDLQEEDPRIAEFCERQPRLFEPEHAFHFGLLDEQEVQKEGYRARRRELGPVPWANRSSS
jgi:tetratricopeptide (TPR) repeat protein